MRSFPLNAVYLNSQLLTFKTADMVAESRPDEKEMMISVIMNCIDNNI